ncbi:thioredoxin family protein [Candidatus Kapaibacterium sp.]
MLNIKVLGTGCSKCLKLENNVKDTIALLGIDAEVEKVTDLNKIMSYGVSMTPGLVINEKVVSFGRVLSVKDIAELINKG